MRDAIGRIRDVAGPSLAATPPSWERLALSDGNKVELGELLEGHNGFYAFLSSLHVFPATNEATSIDIATWNEPTLWREKFSNITDGCIFFAEDLFGVQFAFRSDGIVRFNPDIATVVRVADHLTAWAEHLMTNHREWTGWPLAEVWQRKHGAIHEGKRLYPKKPVVVGGDYSADNLYAGDPVERMRFYGDFAKQIRHLSDGTRIRLELAK